ncbi:uncharacterized protein LOC6033544 [Culex quinquefasciatus]|uniref:uncharacterized protein LOC6033544 n=1 Tax=Culex quinquefasciatus TaxID=7176 RepID=UPI0018E312B2|nr:uncharacterized protein LOC6033544 [Culex quinquefasciatus]
MIKIVALFVALCGVSAAYTIPMRNAIMYYRQAMPYMAPQQAMYGFHYQNQQLQNQRRSAGVSAFAAGNTIATGTYLKDCQNSDVESAELPVQADQSVQSVAEAFPEEAYPAEADAPQYDVPAVHEIEEPLAEEPQAAPVAPVVIPDQKKKVTVQLESAEEDEEEVFVGRRGARPALPNTYFPINFGSTNGGAIAIANSYSTGKGGSAHSTATAYGSPAAAASADLKKTPVAQLKKKPAKLRARKY